MRRNYHRTLDRSGGAIDVSELKQAIADAIGDYAEDIADIVKATNEDVAKFAVKLLKETSPKRKRKGGGAYAKSWTWTTRKRTRYGGNVVVHNKNHYRLTHLLENGHANRDGSFTKPVVHIKPVEEKSVKKFISDLKNAIKKG